MHAATPTLELGTPAERWPALGLGTWRLGESTRTADRETSLIRKALDIGYRLFDTAEMYADGGAEEMLSDALDGIRDKVFLVSKVYPHNASFKGVRAAAERSLKRMNTDVIDLYLLHWRGSVPFPRRRRREGAGSTIWAADDQP